MVRTSIVFSFVALVALSAVVSIAFGVAKMARKQANTLCVMSFVMFLCTFPLVFLFFVTAIIVKEPVFPPLAGLVIAFWLFVTAVVGLIGMLDYSGARGRYTEGFRYAVSAVSFSCLGVLATLTISMIMFGRYAAEYEGAALGSRLSDHTSFRFGYTVRLDDARWQAWTTIREDFDTADFGYFTSEGAGLVVVAMEVAASEVTDEDLCKVFFADMGIGYPSADLRMHLTRRGEPMDRIYDFSREINEGEWYRYALRPVRQMGIAHDVAFLVAAWDLAEDVTDFQELVDLVERFEPPPATFSMPRSSYGRWRGKIQASLTNELGIELLNSDRYRIAYSLFTRATELDDTSSVYPHNGAWTALKLNRGEEGLELLESRRALFEEDSDLRFLRAEILYAIGRQDEGLSEYAALFDSGLRSDSEMIDFVDALDESGRHEEAASRAIAYREGGGSFELDLRLARLYSENDEYEKAAAALDAMDTRYGWSSDLAYVRAKNGLWSQAYTECLAECDELIRRGYDGAYTHYLKGRAELGLDWYRESKESFQLALDGEPTSATYREALDYVSDLLGEGPNAAIQDEIAPVQYPARYRESPQTIDGPYYQGYAAYYEAAATAIRFDADGKYRRTQYRRVRIVDQRGVDDFSSLRIEYDPVDEDVYVNRVRVVDDDGTILAEGKVSDYYVLDDGGQEYATRNRTVTVPVPGLRAGATLEYEWTLKSLGTYSEYPFERVYLGSGNPVARFALYVTGELGALAHDVVGDVRFEENADALIWSTQMPPVYRDEPFGSDVSYYYPHVALGPNGIEWASAGREYLAEINDRLAMDSALRDVLRTPEFRQGPLEARVQAMATHVQNALTYHAIEFGSRARVPNFVRDIVRNGYGDCKDHALLLHQMLMATGIESALALVNTDSPVLPHIPSLNQFDHMIVYVPGIREGQFIDCTSKGGDPLLPAPVNLDEKHALVLEPSDPRLVRIPANVAARSAVRVSQTLAAIDDRRITVEETVTLTGHAAQPYRSYFQNEDTVDFPALFQQFLREGERSLRIEQAEIGSLFESGKPFTVSLRYTLDRTTETVDSARTFHAPLSWFHHLLDFRNAPGRSTPFRIRYPWTFESTFNLGPAHRLSETTAHVTERSGQFASWRLERSNSRSGPAVAFSGTFETGFYPPEEYATFHTEYQAILDAVADPMRIDAVQAVSR